MEIKLTIFTPTYNRADTLPRLYESLRKQTCKNFEWLVINDGSKDDTDEVFKQWLRDNSLFPIHYYKVENGGKNRAINRAVQLAQGKYFFIVDSDDFLLPNAVDFVLECFSKLGDIDYFIGISTIKGDVNARALNGDALIDVNVGYVDCNNLERYKYNLTADMAEVFFTDKLKKYPFPVWDGEKFTPEAVIWDRMALDGYMLRWYNKVIYICEYQQGGMSNSTWTLLRDNPMGYAMLFNIKLEYLNNLKLVINYTLQYISCCCLAKQKIQIFKCCRPILAIFLFPLGWLISRRRRIQINYFCK